MNNQVLVSYQSDAFAWFMIWFEYLNSHLYISVPKSFVKLIRKHNIYFTFYINEIEKQA